MQLHKPLRCIGNCDKRILLPRIPQPNEPNRNPKLCTLNPLTRQESSVWPQMKAASYPMHTIYQSYAYNICIRYLCRNAIRNVLQKTYNYIHNKYITYVFYRSEHRHMRDVYSIRSTWCNSQFKSLWLVRQSYSSLRLPQLYIHVLVRKGCRGDCTHPRSAFRLS